MTRRFTGWHMLVVMVAFFGVVITVNMTMATLATRSFGGVVVQNSYVANQHFNSWLAAARRQQDLGWSAKARVADRRLEIVAGASGIPLSGVAISGVAAHPLGRVPEIALSFDEAATGRYVARTRLPDGRWRLRLRLARGQEHADFVLDVRT